MMRDGGGRRPQVTARQAAVASGFFHLGVARHRLRLLQILGRGVSDIFGYPIRPAAGLPIRTSMISPPNPHFPIRPAALCLDTLIY